MFQVLWNRNTLLSGWERVQSPFGARAKKTERQKERQTDRIGGEWVQSPLDAKAEQTDRQT